MRRIRVDGRLGADAKIETTTTGKQVLKFRMAGGEPGESEPMWFTVDSFDAFHISKLAPYLKKGSAVSVTGRYKDGIFTKKDGTIDISRIISATDIAFPDFMKKEGENNHGQMTENKVAIQQVNVKPIAVQQPVITQVQAQPINQQPVYQVQPKPINQQPAYQPQQSAYQPQYSAGDDSELPF